MDLDDAREFVRTHHRAVLATRTSSGIQQSPVLVGVDDEGRLTVSSRETAFKTKNLRADAWAQLCVLNDRFFGEWIYVEGETEVVSLARGDGAARAVLPRNLGRGRGLGRLPGWDGA